MQLEDFQNAWDSQPDVAGELDLRGMVTDDTRRLRRGQFTALVFFVLGAAFACYVFWSMWIVDERSFFRALLSAGPMLIPTVAQLFVLRQLRLQSRQREASARVPEEYLSILARDLDLQLNQLRSPVFILVSVAAVGLIAVTKWFDYQQGVDTPMECIAIVMFTIAMMIAVGAAVWHYREQFLVPRWEHVHGLLSRIRSDGTPAS